MSARRFKTLEALKADLEAKYNVTVIASALDVSDPKSCEEFYYSLPVEVRDNVDFLVNNAGTWPLPAAVHESNWDDLTSVIDTNVKGVIKMIKLFVPGMLKRQSGHIINVSSIVGKDTLPNLSLYAGSKHMLEAITHSLRAELVATPLRVSLISPGLTVTELTNDAYKDPSKAASWFTGYEPLIPSDVADSIVYVASRPPHVQVVDLTICPSAQASVHLLHRDTPKTDVN